MYNPATTEGLKLLDYIYINPDGTLFPEAASNIIKSDGNVYTFTSNISNTILIERNNTILDGAGFTLEGPGNGAAIMILTNNATVKNIRMISWNVGVHAESNEGSIIENYIMANVSMLIRGSNFTISGNYLINNPNGNYEDANKAIVSGDIPDCGIEIDRATRSSNFNNITNNQIFNFENAIRLMGISGNLVTGNNLVNNSEGITLQRNTSNNTFAGNNIKGCSTYAVSPVEASNNTFYGNNFIDNKIDVLDGNTYKLLSKGISINYWDNGTIGNYWSDYQTKYPEASQIDNSGIENTPYELYSSNIDHYPLANPTAAGTFLLK